jgi:hypothetical protein
MIKAALFLFIAAIILILLEYTYIPAILYATNKTIQEINATLFINFLISLPERFVEFGIIILLLINKSSVNQKNFLKAVITNPTLRNATIALLIFNFTLLLIIGKFIVIDKCLADKTFNLQMLITTSIIIFPLTNLSIFFGVLYYKVNRELDERHLTSINIKNHIKTIRSFTHTGDLVKIEKSISEIESYIDDLETHY